jgi:signal transduction histidine kinase
MTYCGGNTIVLPLAISSTPTMPIRGGIVSTGKVFMSLRTRTLAIIMVILLSTFLFFFLVTNTYILNSFTKLEEDFSRHHAEQFTTLINSDLQVLSGLADDWASWDDTYAFIDDVNPEYISSNLVEGTLVSLQLNLMLYVNNAGEVVYGMAVDLETEEEIPITPELDVYLQPGSLLLTHPDYESNVRGIIRYQDMPMLVVSEPILTTLDTGPIRGSFIIGRYLTQAEIERLSSLTGVPVSIASLNAPDLAADMALAKTALDEGAEIFVHTLSDQSMASYTVLDDITGNPLLIVRAETERSIFQEGRDSITLILWLILGACIIVGIISAVYIERAVLSRIFRLSRKVTSISDSGDTSGRISISGSDELSELANNINRMLAALETSHAELLDKSSQLSTINQNQSDFLAHMSHELRTPLNAILGFSEMLQDDFLGDTNQEQRECLKDIEAGGRHMLDLINDVLDLSKIESGKIVIQPNDLNLSTLIPAVIKDLKPLFAECSHKVTVKIEPDAPLVRADRKIFRQVLTNLLSNAIKFTPDKGRISVSVRSNADHCRICVSDSGIGIKEEFYEKVFQAFIQAESLPKKPKQGTGLGLKICQQYIALMGGRIWVESEYGKGSDFIFTLPVVTDMKQ